MTPGVADVRPPLVSRRGRLWFAASALVLFVLALVPPLSGWAHHYQALEALQFSLLAIVVPALLAAGAPWWLVGLASGPGARVPAGRPAAPFDRLADARRRHPEFVRSLAFLALDLAVIVCWRTPAAVDAALGHRWLVVVEGLTLALAGLGLWLECVASPPLRPRAVPPLPGVLAAIAMWVVWTFAYMVGFSQTSWYRGFHHVAGQGLSAAADQQLSTWVLWTVAAVAFMPVVFWNLVRWLRTDEDPDDELFRLMKGERRRRWATPQPLPGRQGDGAPPTA